MCRQKAHHVTLWLGDLALAGKTTHTVGCMHASSEASILPAKMLSILRKARLKDKELRILML